MSIPAKTSLYIGPGMRVEGRITQTTKDETIVVAGTLAGDISSEGVVLVESGGLIEAANELRCFELRVSGKIEGKDVVVEAGILRLESSARVEVGEVNLPPGGLEQNRGSVLCAKLVMGQDNAFAKDERLSAPTLAPEPPKAAALDRSAQMAVALGQVRVSGSASAAQPAASVAAARVVPLSAASSVTPSGAVSSSSVFDEDKEESNSQFKMA